MSYTADLDRSLDLAQRAIKHAQKHGMAPTPRNFEIWYQYVSGENGALNEDIDRRISDGDQITESVAGEIQNQYFSPSQSADNVVSLSSKISIEIEQAIAVISAAAGTNSAYGTSLEGVGSQIGKVKNADDLRTIAETLVKASRDMENGKEQQRSGIQT